MVHQPISLIFLKMYYYYLPSYDNSAELIHQQPYGDRLKMSAVLGHPVHCSHVTIAIKCAIHFTPKAKLTETSHFRTESSVQVTCDVFGHWVVGGPVACDAVVADGVHSVAVVLMSHHSCVRFTCTVVQQFVEFAVR
jgi:hypothetical protein